MSTVTAERPAASVALALERSETPDATSARILGDPRPAEPEPLRSSR